MPDVLTPAIVAALIGGVTSYSVARTTTRSTTRVEREKLAHSRREKAISFVLSLNEHMDVVANEEVLEDLRRSAAREAHTSLVAVHLTLQAGDGESSTVNELLHALRAPQELDAAVHLWRGMRDDINAGRLPAA